MIKKIKKRFDLNVPTANTMHSGNFELDKNITKIVGLTITSDREELMYYRGTQRIEINREEIFPEGYESKLLMSGINVSPNQRYYDLGGIEPGNSKIKMEYRDNPSTLAAFAAYRVTLYVDCEMTEE